MRNYLSLLSFTLISLAGTAHAVDQFTQLNTIAEKSLLMNVTILGSGPYLTAGRRQFKTLWTRDFCQSVRGLLLIGRADVVRNQLTRLITSARETDGLVPRVMDSMSVQERVVLSQLHIDLAIRDPLKAYYEDEHGSAAIDSNALVLLSALDYYKSTRDETWWAEMRPTLVRILSFYKAYRRGDGLIVQQPFSDWQDSVNRAGATAYTNLVYLHTLRSLAPFSEFQIGENEMRRVRERFNEVFLKGDLYRSIEGQDYISADANVLAIDWGLAGADLYRALRASSLWTTASGFPGKATVPNYPSRYKNPTVRFAGIAAYHDDVTWSWLMVVSARVAFKVGDKDEATRILQQMSKVADRDQVIGEIYETNPELPLYKSWLYRSEAPFSWGSAAIIETLNAVDK